jgi:hypothetical protein
LRDSGKVAVFQGNLWFISTFKNTMIGWVDDRVNFNYHMHHASYIMHHDFAGDSEELGWDSSSIHSELLGTCPESALAASRSPSGSALDGRIRLGDVHDAVLKAISVCQMLYITGILLRFQTRENGLPWPLSWVPDNIPEPPIN